MNNNVDIDDITNYETPVSSPRGEKVCPWAPKKPIACEGCRIMVESGTGGENQEAHVGAGGCLENIFDDYKLTRKPHTH